VTASVAQATSQAAQATSQAATTLAQGGQVTTAGQTYRIVPTPAILTLPLFILLALITALGVGLWLSALNVIYRDINYVLPFLTQFWLFITPIAYPSSMIKNETLRLLYALNPMTGVVEGFRWALLGTQTAPGPMLAVSATISVLVLISGLFYFRRMERTFADMV
jgi:lipopolysaccharide transport system permease protein